MIMPTSAGIVCSVLVTIAERQSPTTAIVKVSAPIASAIRNVPARPSAPGSPTVAMKVTTRPCTNAAAPSTMILLVK